MKKYLLENTYLTANNKVGKLKADKDGYYPMTLGAVGLKNLKGVHYTVDQKIRQILTQTSKMKKLERMGRLRGELEHPEWVKGMTLDAFMERWEYIDLKNACASIKDTYVEDGKADDGSDVLFIRGLVCPSGAHFSMLERSLKNPDENVDFSGRYLAYEYMEKGVPTRYLDNCITFDTVGIGGERHSNKYLTPACESANGMLNFEMELTDRDFEAFARRREERTEALAAFGESNTETVFRDELLNGQWNRVELVELGAAGW